MDPPEKRRKDMPCCNSPVHLECWIDDFASRRERGLVVLCNKCGQNPFDLKNDDCPTSENETNDPSLQSEKYQKENNDDDDTESSISSLTTTDDEQDNDDSLDDNDPPNLLVWRANPPDDDSDDEKCYCDQCNIASNRPPIDMDELESVSSYPESSDDDQ